MVVAALAILVPGCGSEQSNDQLVRFEVAGTLDFRFDGEKGSEPTAEERRSCIRCCPG